MRGEAQNYAFCFQIMNVSTTGVYQIYDTTTIALDMIDVHEICWVAILPRHDRKAVDSSQTSIRNAETS